MNIVFRADASLDIGTGHVMRCLTLAQGLKEQGHSCRFICRDHLGHLNDFIQQKGFDVCLLPAEVGRSVVLDWCPHAEWLTVEWQLDAQQTLEAIGASQVDWLVVDHYALDYQWEAELLDNVDRIMLIDDLADRKHVCSLLVDQTFGRLEEDYRPLVPMDCQLLCGADYALLRPEFAQWRDYSLERRINPTLNNLLVTMGGVDKDNVTTKVLDALKLCHLPELLKITIVLGSTAPHLQQVQQVARSMPWRTEVRVGVENMAQLMAESDLAIGAAGATTWERCCLGLPSVLVVLAKNQENIAQSLVRINAVALIKDDISGALPDVISKVDLSRLTQKSITLTNGQGVASIVDKMEHDNALI